MSRVPPQFPVRGPCPIAFVGEAPSWDELAAGKPLVGPAGQTFNAMLRTAGLRREDYLVTNVFDEKLPDNEIASWLMPMAEARALPDGTALPPVGKGGFLRLEHRHHLVRLEQELKQCAPTVIVPLGGTALWALTGQNAISAVRGTTMLATRIAPGVKLLPTFHPQAVNYQWKFFVVVVGDLIRASAEAALGPSIVLPKRELLLEPTLGDIRDYLPRLLGAELLSVDIETAFGSITSIQFAPDVEHAINIPFRDDRQPDRSYWRRFGEEVAAWKLVRDILASPVPKLGQNFGAYDAYWLLTKYHMQVRNSLHDTRLLHHALYPELPKDLEFMGNSYSNQGAWKFWARHDKRDD